MNSKKFLSVLGVGSFAFANILSYLLGFIALIDRIWALDLKLYLLLVNPLPVLMYLLFYVTIYLYQRKYFNNRSGSKNPLTKREQKLKYHVVMGTGFLLFSLMTIFDFLPKTDLLLFVILLPLVQYILPLLIIGFGLVGIIRTQIKKR